MRLFIFLLTLICLTNAELSNDNLDWTNRYNETEWNDLMTDLDGWHWKNVLGVSCPLDHQTFDDILYKCENTTNNFSMKILNRMMDIVDGDEYTNSL